MKSRSEKERTVDQQQQSDVRGAQIDRRKWREEIMVSTELDDAGG
jgi:hypothetical protein